jgi:hypothetical protein
LTKSALFGERARDVTAALMHALKDCWKGAPLFPPPQVAARLFAGSAFRPTTTAPLPPRDRFVLVSLRLC